MNGHSNMSTQLKLSVEKSEEDKELERMDWLTGQDILAWVVEVSEALENIKKHNKLVFPESFSESSAQAFAVNAQGIELLKDFQLAANNGFKIPAKDKIKNIYRNPLEDLKIHVQTIREILYPGSELSEGEELKDKRHPGDGLGTIEGAQHIFNGYEKKLKIIKSSVAAINVIAATYDI